MSKEILGALLAFGAGIGADRMLATATTSYGTDFAIAGAVGFAIGYMVTGSMKGAALCAAAAVGGKYADEKLILGA